jgi:molybdate transport system substrate-binding protein
LGRCRDRAHNGGGSACSECWFDRGPADVSTFQGLKQALQSADTLIFNNVASGNYFATVLERLGIAEAVKTKVTRTTPPDVIARIVQGKGSDIGVYPVTLIVADRRLKLIGALPSELQSYIAYAAERTLRDRASPTGPEVT